MPVRDRQHLRRTLMQVAGQQSGYFTAAQALSVGYSYQAQRHHVAHGNWLRVDRGLFRLPEWPSGRFEHLVRWALLTRGNGVVSHETALAVHDISDADPGRVHLTVRPTFRGRISGPILHRAVLAESDVDEHAGFGVTTPARTLIDVADGTLDQDALDQAVSQAIERGVVGRRALLVAARARSERAARRVERALGQVPA